MCMRSWLEPCIDGLNGHSVPHCFKFFLEDGKAMMYFRHWSSDAWCNADVAVKVLSASLHVPLSVHDRELNFTMHYVYSNNHALWGCTL